MFFGGNDFVGKKGQGGEAPPLGSEPTEFMSTAVFSIPRLNEKGSPSGANLSRKFGPRQVLKKDSNGLRLRHGLIFTDDKGKEANLYELLELESPYVSGH